MDNPTTAKNFFKTVLAANSIERLTDDKETEFRELYLWPAKAHTNGRLVDNAGVVYIGEYGSGPDVTPSVLNIGDAPLAYKVPDNQPPMKLHDMLIQADNAGDGVFGKYK